MDDTGSNRAEWLRVRLRPSLTAELCERFLAECGVATVCLSCRCPHTHECLSCGIVTFMILGTTCTRACGFCAVGAGMPGPVDRGEPSRVAAACAQLELRHVVITSVTRDDLPDGGASQFAATVRAVRRGLPRATQEVLVPDFQGSQEALGTVLAAAPNVLGHNLETVPRLYHIARGADYGRSLRLLHSASGQDGLLTKSGLMLGVGETAAEVHAVMADLREAGCQMLTIGQYLPPSRHHPRAARLVPPHEFDELAVRARGMGFVGVAAGPLVRSSFRAGELLRAAST